VAYDRSANSKGIIMKVHLTQALVKMQYLLTILMKILSHYLSYV
jgi:hypothetical protein